MTANPIHERDLHAGILGDLDFAAQALANLDAAGHTDGAERARAAHNELSCAIAWIRDRLGHATGAPCLFAVGSGHCLVDAEGAAP